MGTEPARRSIFARLLAVMVAMALGVPLVIAGFFFLGLLPSVNTALDGHLDAAAQLMAASDPDPAAARAFAARYDLGIRYEGPRGAWTTEPGVPTAGSIAPHLPTEGALSRRWGTDGRVVRRPDGGLYIFVSHLRARAQRVHDRLVLALLGTVVLLVALAHEVLRRSLAPIRALHRGVTALGAGDLGVAVPTRGDDELGALGRAFNAMVVRVGEMVRSRDQLLLDVSHELRSPLTRMRVALALQPEDGTRARLERNVAEMEGMVTALLEEERLRAGRGLEAGDHDLVEVVRDAVLAFADRPPGIVLEEAPEAARAVIDPDRVRSVMNNLLENALRHALPDSGPIRVTVGVSGRHVEVAVADDGPGFPPGELPRLFGPFFRVDRSRSRRTGGYGLGLSLCQRILEAHGGTIEARNGPGRGAVVRLRFPVEGPPKGLQAEGGSPAP